MLLGVDAFKTLDSMAKNRSDAGRAFSARNKPKLLWGNTRKRNASAFQLTDEFSRVGRGKQPFAVNQGIDDEPMIYRFNEVAHTLDKEETMPVAVAAMVLQLTDFG